MATQVTYIAILSLLLINQSTAQTGEGCWLKTCSQPGQVRINAKVDPNTGAFLGGCNCGCPPEMADPQHANYCGAPRTVAFDSSTLVGDCSCSCPATSPDPTSCVAPAVWDESKCDCGCPSWAPLPTDCVLPQVFLPSSCSCGCEIGPIGGPCQVAGAGVAASFVTADCTCDTTLVTCPGNQVADATGKCGCPDVAPNGLFLPTCVAPLTRDPLTCDCVTTTTTGAPSPAPGPAVATCESVGACSCPPMTQGVCTINCDVGNDACKDGTIECNNDGFDCIVNCLTGSACAGAANIVGPANGALTVNCIGAQSCEGATTMNGELGTDLTVKCEGGQSCKGSISLLFGTGVGSLTCIGAPDSCQGMTAGSFTLPADALGFSCDGQFCPVAAPAPFNNAPPTLPVVPAPPLGGPVVPAPLGPGNFVPAPPGGGIVPGPPVPPQQPPQFTTPIVGQPQPQPQPQTPVAQPPIPIPPQRPSPPFVGVPQPLPPQPPIPGNPLPVQPIAPGSPVTPPGGGTLVLNNQAPIPIVIPDEIVICEAGPLASCDCSGTRTCTIKCEQQDACKEVTLNCPLDHDCTVVCTGDASCVSATINAPVGKDFTLNAAGISSCTDTKIHAVNALNTAYTCSGKDACKGATTVNCGTGSCEISCQGEAACDSAQLMPNQARAFACSGAGHCPPSYTAPPVPVPTYAPTEPCQGWPACTCNGALQCFAILDPNERCGCVCPLSILQKEALGDPKDICGANSPGQVYISSACGCDCPAGANRNCPLGQVFNQNTCQCECPGGNTCPGSSIMNMDTCQCQCPPATPTISDCSAVGKVLRNCECQCQTECPGIGQIQSPLTCGCACPAGTPTAAQCESGIVDELECKCAPPAPSTYCCHPQIDGFKPWRGRCWGRTTEFDCNAESNGRCVWKGDTVNGQINPHPHCLPSPPHNDILPNQACVFRDGVCGNHAQCCSEVCRVTGGCR